MRLYILGESNDDKGMQLEELTVSILKECGYEYIRRNTIEAGGSEIDVKAKRYLELDGVRTDIPVICECKAKNAPITINDWLKFVGKVSIARMNNTRAEGIMIALSGTNGNVTGCLDALPDKSYLKLITNEDLINLVCSHYKLKKAEDIRSYFARHTVRTIDNVDLVYYDKQVWWLVSFINEEYTLVTDRLTTIEEKNLDGFLDMLSNYTTYKKTGYTDVMKEEMARVRENFIIKGVVLLLMQKGCMAIGDVLQEVKSY